MDILFRTLGPWGPGVGRNLHAAEIDTNFWELGNAIVALQNNPIEPTGIESIAVNGTQMTIYLTNGEVMGPFTLPVLVFRWRGDWAADTTYAVLDVFTVPDDGIYMVIAAHTSGSEFDRLLVNEDGDPAYQQLFGSSSASLSTLGDVIIEGGLTANDAMLWRDDLQLWVNKTLHSMAFQEASAVAITGGTITGLTNPVNPADASTKAYVDTAVSTGTPGTIPSLALLANISIGPSSAVGVAFSDYLDYVLSSTTRGTLLYRGAPGWIALPPGTAGSYLRTAGAGADPSWSTGSPGTVTAITGGTGIDTTPDTIVDTGTVALEAVADSTLLANISGSSTAPTPTTLTLFLDHVFSAARGTVLTRAISGWVALSPGTTGQFLKTQGVGADLMWDSPVGSGTVTSISAGTGISTGGSPITGTGTVALAAIANLNVLANTSGSSAAPVATTVTLLFDRAFGTTQGAVLYRSASAWVLLTPGTSGQVLTTGGASANPAWQDAPISGSSTPNLRIVSNISGASAVPTGNTLTNILDAIISSARGTLLYRTNSGWTGLAPGTSGQVLQTGGGGGDPSWITNGGGSLAISSPAARDILVYNSSSGKFENTRPKYEIGCYVPSTMVANQNLLFHRFSKAVTLPANLGPYLNHNTVAGGGVAATGSTAITLAKALAATPTSFSTVATLTIAAGSLTASLSTQAAISFAQGDVLRVRGPATADGTFADFHMSLVGFET